MGHILPATVTKSESNNGGLDTAAKGIMNTSIVYFDQQMGALHVVCWSKSFIG